MNNLKIDRFKKIIFVSKNSKEAFLQVMSNLENKVAEETAEISVTGKEAEIVETEVNIKDLKKKIQEYTTHLQHHLRCQRKSSV